MKKIALAVAVSVLAVLIVLPVVRSVNVSADKPITVDQTQYADGSSVTANTLVADGWPLPPPIPPSPTGTLVADGWPLPPPIPPASLQGQVLA